MSIKSFFEVLFVIQSKNIRELSSLTLLFKVIWKFVRYGTFVQIKKRENTFEGVMLLVKLQAEACNLTKSLIPPPWVFFTCFKFYKW